MTEASRIFLVSLVADGGCPLRGRTAGMRAMPLLLVTRAWVDLQRQSSAIC